MDLCSRQRGKPSRLEAAGIRSQPARWGERATRVYAALVFRIKRLNEDRNTLRDLSLLDHRSAEVLYRELSRVPVSARYRWPAFSGKSLTLVSPDPSTLTPACRQAVDGRSPKSVRAQAEHKMNESRSIPPGARVGETLKFRMITHVTSAQSLDIGDVEGHTASLARFSGLAFFPDDKVGTVFFTSLTDYTKGAGAFTLYPILTFDDDSVLWLKSVGTGKVDGTKTHFVGTLTVLGGTGRFAGAKGDGTLTGTRYTPLSVGADLVSDYVVNLDK